MAKILHKTVGEIRAMPHEEWVHWHAFLASEAQDRELASKGAGSA